MERKTNKTMPRWKERSVFEKRLAMVSLFLGISVMILALASLMNIWQGSSNLVQVALGLLMLVQALQFWKYNRIIAILSLVVAIFNFGVLATLAL